MELFSKRHIGPRAGEIEEMLHVCGFNSMEELISATIPDSIRSPKAMDLPPAMSEYEYLNHMGELARKNKVFSSYIGMGYHDTILPSVIKRNILSNHGH